MLLLPLWLIPVWVFCLVGSFFFALWPYRSFFFALWPYRPTGRCTTGSAFRFFSLSFGDASSALLSSFLAAGFAFAASFLSPFAASFLSASSSPFAALSPVAVFLASFAAFLSSFVSLSGSSCTKASFVVSLSFGDASSALLSSFLAAGFAFAASFLSAS